MGNNRCAEENRLQGVCHVSTALEAIYMVGARARGESIHGEMSSVLLFHEGQRGRNVCRVFAVMKPPLQGQGKDGLLLGLYAMGSLRLTGSDHAPIEERRKTEKQDQLLWQLPMTGFWSWSFLFAKLLMNAVTDRLLEAIARNTWLGRNAAVLGIQEKEGLRGRTWISCLQKLDVPKPLNNGTVYKMP